MTTKSSSPASPEAALPPGPRVSLASDETREATRASIQVNKTIEETAKEAAPQLLEKPNEAFVIAYPDVSDRRVFRNKLRIALGRELNSLRKSASRQLFISDDDGQIKVYYQDLAKL